MAMVVDGARNENEELISRISYPSELEIFQDNPGALISFNYFSIDENGYPTSVEMIFDPNDITIQAVGDKISTFLVACGINVGGAKIVNGEDL